MIKHIIKKLYKLQHFHWRRCIEKYEGGGRGIYGARDGDRDKYLYWNKYSDADIDSYTDTYGNIYTY